ncbi:methyltransferase domain-containing protein [Echinicola marina]|uniref:methyltransferase domain-containing protein n=1 Tax=Echinicola marina TaxID=2859768 RepID=UPI001CF6BF93|nr:methyltransferase domain-containing protein [Echinicola marina]UCS92721.1 methyltransferase domain-containing protein [Echinicola marina]
MALHYGFWDENVQSHRQALWNMNYQIAKNAQIKKTDIVLDAGCGVGGTSFFLANNIGCFVEGISLSEAHIKRALEYKKIHDPKNLVKFTCQNFCNTSFPDNSFDVIFGIESVVHAENKTDFLKEAFRLLKPGGRLLISDYFLRQPQSTDERLILKKWADSWAIDDFIYEDNFLIEVKKTGFNLFFLKDISKNVYPSIKLMHRSYYPRIFISRISNFFGRRTNKQLENSKSGKFQYQSYSSKVWKYKHFLAFKNLNENLNTFEDFVKTDPPCEFYVDNEKLRERFPILSKKGFIGRNILKRTMHYYLEKGIKNSHKRF